MLCLYKTSPYYESTCIFLMSMCNIEYCIVLTIYGVDFSLLRSWDPVEQKQWKIFKCCEIHQSTGGKKKKEESFFFFFFVIISNWFLLASVISAGRKLSSAEIRHCQPLATFPCPLFSSITSHLFISCLRLPTMHHLLEMRSIWVSFCKQLVLCVWSWHWQMMKIKKTKIKLTIGFVYSMSHQTLRGYLMPKVD